MFRLTLTAWTLLILGGLALATSVTHESSVGFPTTPDQSFTSSIVPLATIVADSEHLNHNGTTRIGPATTVTILCPMISGGAKVSVLFPDRPLGPFSWSNQTFHKGSSTHTNSATVSVPQATDLASPSSKIQNLIFDHGPTPPLPLSTSTNSTLAVGSGHRLIYRDRLLWLFFGMVNIGVI
ncbi:hypothetical protein BKA61DRAFT_584309 [Leptodontidium sp. MPI-SDFR-AT-0119]|nr:hypothetical protein BKA61DRAFT_584309 [Leptodontidium sp. MPI-SDFR-AT-0119]